MQGILDNIKKIAFTRSAGSLDERTLSDMLYYEYKDSNLETETFDFSFKDSLEKYAYIEVIEPYYKKYDARAYGLSGYTLKEGITAPITYIEDGLGANLINVKDSICISNGRMVPDLYTKLYYRRAKAFVTFSGSLYSENQTNDKKILSKRHLEVGRLLGINVLINDAQEMIKNHASKARICVCQEEIDVKSENVVVTIKGESPETILLTAHIDSTANSKGIFDNATGVAIMMELINYFKDKKIKRTLKFVFCASSNRGFLGIRNYLDTHEDLIKYIKLNINFDALGTYLGQNVAYCATDPSLLSYLSILAHECDLSLICKNTICPSDSIAFTERLIPSVTFHKDVPMGGPLAHSELDNINNISEKDLNKIYTFVRDFIESLLESSIFMVPYKLPQNVIDDCEKFNERRKIKK